MDLQKLLNGSEAKLTTVHPTIRDKGLELIKRAHAEGINILITQGLRTIEYQNQLYAQGRTTAGNIVTNVKGGYSYHNYGLAIDFAVYGKDEKSINWTVDKSWRRVGAIGQSLGLEWGGAWTDFVDNPHFQYTFGLSISKLRAGHKPPQEVSNAYKVVQGKKDLGSFKTLDGAVAEAKKWTGSNVLKISDGSIVWTFPTVKADDLKPVVKIDEPKSEVKKLDAKTIDAAKQAIDDLAKAGLLSSPDYWKARVEENMPVWAYMTIESRKLKK